jgi:UDP-N-acetyl-2-amino-2-deoxyglucuronate dehydrogenase
MKVLGFAIAGSGMVAGVHATALQEIPEAKLLGVWSHTPSKTHKFADQYHIHGYQSYEELLRNPDIQVVILCLPSGYHGEYGEMAAISGKHVVVEKPIDISLAGARNLIEVCRKNDVKLSVIFQHRFTPAAQKIRHAIDQGVLGKLILGDAYVKWYRSPEYYRSSPWRGTKSIDGGGALMMQAIHTIDLLQWLMGGIKYVTGFIKTSVHKIETEDLGVAAVEYLSGAVGVIEGATAIQPGFKERMEIHGERGSIILEGGNIKEWKVEGCNELDYIDERKIIYGSTSSPAISHVNHKAQLKEIISAIQENREPLVNGEEGLKSIQIVLGIYESSEKKQQVELRSVIQIPPYERIV